MRTLLMAAASASMAVAMPALAKPGGAHGKAGVHGSTHARTSVSGGHARTDSRANVRARTRTGASVNRTRDSDGDGIPDYRDRTDNRGQRYGANACPPGLAAKNNGCLPPGQAKRMFYVGQRIPTGYSYYTPYDQIPAGYRDQYGLASNSRYIYRDNSIYVVDPATSLVTRIINLIR
ncbi:MAG TPA: hypothetical protein VHM92_08370 [Allosphingosinicella sp.]|nr:hypothetical protein [Allosphingosinicella sp.]